MSPKNKYFFLFVTLIIFVVVKFIYLGFVPLFDGWSYAAETIYEAVSKPFNLFNFDPGGHSSFVYVLLISFLQFFDIGNIYFFHIPITLVGVASILGFYGLADELFFKGKNRMELNILTVLFAFFPLNLASALHINVDYGVMAFLILFLCFLYKKKYKWAFVMAIGLIFSKEVGLIYLTVSLCSYTIWRIVVNKQHKRPILRLLLSKAYFLLLYVFYAIHSYLLISQNSEFAYWANPLKLNVPSIPEAISVLIPKAYFLVVFFINFNWILTLFMASGIILSLFLVIFRRKSVNDFGKISTVLVILIVSYIAISSYKTYVNPRYFQGFYPLLILLFYFGLQETLPIKKIRIIVLAIVTGLFLISNIRTIDPLSKKVYGTFQFGKHEMLNTTSITKECCGYGRDQLVYNLEFTHIHYLLNKINKGIPANENTVYGYFTDLHPVFFNVDKDTLERTAKRKNNFTIRHITPYEVGTSNNPSTIYYLDVPISLPNNFLDLFLNVYKIKDKKIYSDDGYEMSVYELILK